MDLHLNKDLNEIYKELLKFNPQSSILTRKSLESNSIFCNWMEQYLQVYHQLVMEFNPNKININTNTNTKKQAKKQTKKQVKTLSRKETKKNRNQSSYNKLQILFKKILELNPTFFEDNLEFENMIKRNNCIHDLKKAIQHKSKQLFGNWLNIYNQEIFETDNDNISLINILEKYVSNFSINSNNINSNNSINNKIIKNIIEIINLLNSINRFLSLNNSDEIDNSNFTKYTYNDNELSFEVNSKTKISLNNIYWKFLYARMKSILRLYVKDKDKVNKISFTIFLTDQHKKLPRIVKIFGADEINSGSTNYETITIWRKEEHFKLILHESVHFYNLDGSLDLSQQNDDINLECHYQIGTHNKTRIYEAYTETLATFLNSFANSYQLYYFNYLKNKLKKSEIYPLTKKDFNILSKIHNLIWNLEKKFTLIQIAKIFIISNPNSNDFKDFLVEPEKCDEMREKMQFKLEQRTSVLSYHILKGANLIYDDEFIKWVPNIFQPHPKSLHIFFNYITQKTHSTEFINLINLAIKYLKNLKSYNKNLRMTFYENAF